MADEMARISKIVIYGSRFFISYLVTPKYEDVLYLQECLKRKEAAMITYEIKGRLVTEELEKIEFSKFTTKGSTYTYR